MNKERLIKFLNLTTSSNDGEALSSIRMANRFIKDSDVSWEEIIILYEKNKIQYDDKRFVEFTIVNMNLKKERAYSEELKYSLKGYKNLVKFLILIIIILILGYIL